jgi:biopolymer transport protein ExbD
VVRADQDLPYGEVEKVIAEIEKAEPREISLATSPADEDEGVSP